MFYVDNSGKGNCLYYAYGISLMYYLRAKNNPVTTEDIFNKLKLKAEDKIRLRTLLAKEADEAFSSEEIKKVIEPILGRATRDLAAEHTKIEFKSSPRDTPLFTSANYGLSYCFKGILQQNESELAHLIDVDLFNPNLNFTQAEIYKVDGIKPAMQEFVEANISEVSDELKRQWDEKKVEFEGESLSESEIQKHQATLLDNILREKTVEFFLKDDDKYLNQYIAHLSKEYGWSSEETLMSLHRAIQGERMVRNLEGRIDTLYDTEILLHVHVDGVNPSLSGSPGMILNNHGNVHWTSEIPPSIFTPKVTEDEKRLLDKLNKIQEDFGSMPLSVGTYSVASDWIGDLRKQIDVIKCTSDIGTKEKAIEQFSQVMGKAVIKLASSSDQRALLSDLFSTFLDCVPNFLDKKETLKEDKTSISSQRDILSKSSIHTLIKPLEHKKTLFPLEITPYVRENKQTGPRVATALRKMHQIGLAGDERYSPQKCLDIAQRYMKYVHHSKRHFNLEEVKNFRDEMSEIIAQKEQSSERSCSPG